MISVELVGQFGHQFSRHRHRAGVAVAGRDAVDDALLLQQAVEKGRAARNRGAKRRVGRQDGARAAIGHGRDILELKAIAVETDGAPG